MKFLKMPLCIIHLIPGRPTARSDPSSISIQTDCPAPRPALGPVHEHQTFQRARRSEQSTATYSSAAADPSGEDTAPARGVCATPFGATRFASSIAG